MKVQADIQIYNDVDMHDNELNVAAHPQEDTRHANIVTLSADNFLVEVNAYDLIEAVMRVSGKVEI